MSSWPPSCLLVERQLLGLASSDEKKISNKKKYFHWLPKDHLEVIFIEEDQAQQGPAHAPLVPDNRFDKSPELKEIRGSVNLQSSNMIIFSTVWSICWRISGLICEFGILSLIQQRLCIKNWGHFYQTMMTLITATRGSFSAEVWDPRTFFPTVRFEHNLTGQLYTIHFLGCFYY